MDIVGIICEYNPFHNGHIYHLKKIKEMFPNSIIILVMTGNFTQRGIPSILNKWDKTEISLEYGVDLVLELPFVFTTQSADIFAHGAISILKELKADYLVFGSESNDISMLLEYANISFKKEYQEEVKNYLDCGCNYPTALSKSFSIFKKEELNSPNDLLGLSYIKEIIKQNSLIKPISILRTNSYHDTNITGEISSSTSIRKAVLENIDIKNVVPKIVLDKIDMSPFLIDNYFKFLKYRILTTKDLTIYQSVSEGIESRIKKYISEVTTWEELVQKVKTKRYTYNRINRMFIHILCGFTKEMGNSFKEIEYLRVLGFSKNGRNYLNKIKKEVNLPIITTFSKGNSNMLLFEQQVTNVYLSVLNENEKNELMKMEYQNKVKMKD